MKSNKLTPAIQKKIGYNIVLGMPIKYAAEISGISEKAFYNWMHEGEAAKSGKLFDFYNYITECKAKAIQTHLKIIQKSAKEGNAESSKWMLERRHSKYFGRQDKLEVDANMKHSGEIDINLMPDEVLQRAIDNELNRLLKGRSGNTPEASE